MTVSSFLMSCLMEKVRFWMIPFLLVAGVCAAFIPTSITALIATYHAIPFTLLLTYTVALLNYQLAHWYGMRRIRKEMAGATSL